MTKGEFKEMLREALNDNLSIEVQKNGDHVNINVKFDDLLVCWDYFYIPSLSE